MNWIDLISAVLGLCCVFLAGRRLVANFYFGYVYNIFLFILFAKNALYASMMIQTVSFVINAIGHYRWTHPSEDEQDGNGSLVVSHLTNKHLIFISAMSIAIFAFLLGILTRTDDPQPALDAACTTFILLAQWLSAQKKWECWIVWLVVNVVNLVLYLRAGLSFMPVVSALYLINGIWSLYSWKKNERNAGD